MRFIVKNFGPIKHADVTLGDFTVFIGPGGTGKSYLAYLIWTLQRMEPDWDTLILEIPTSTAFRQAVKEITEMNVISEQTSYDLISTVMEVHEEAIKKNIPIFLKDTFRIENIEDLISWEANHTQIDIYNDSKTKGFTIVINKNGSLFLKGLSDIASDEPFRIEYIKDRRMLVLKYNDIMDYKIIIKDDKDKNVVADELSGFCGGIIPTILRRVLDNYAPYRPSFILTDSKSGLLRIAPSLIRTTLIRTEKLPLNLPDREMLSKCIIDDSTVLDEEVSKIANFLESEIGGKVIIKSYGMMFPEIYFKKGEYEIPLLRAHSGVRELALLITHLKYIIGKSIKIINNKIFKDHFIVMEEPETHLHPYMQSIVTRALAMLSKYADVLITTHSPIILDELDNLIKLNKLSPEEKKKLGYREEEGLDPESLKIYRFKLDGTVEEVRVTEDGIEEEEFSSVIAELSNKYAEVEEAVWRKLHGG